MSKRKKEVPSKIEKKQKIEDSTNTIQDDYKQEYESLFKYFNSFKMNLLKQKANQISIETIGKLKKELVKEVVYIYFLLEKLPIELKILIISFLKVEISSQGWLLHEMERRRKNKEISFQRVSFYRHTFGYFKHDLLRKPFYLFHSLHLKKEGILLIQNRNNEESNIEFIKILVKFSEYINNLPFENLEIFKNYLEYISSSF